MNFIISIPLIINQAKLIYWQFIEVDEDLPWQPSDLVLAKVLKTHLLIYYFHLIFLMILIRLNFFLGKIQFQFAVLVESDWFLDYFLVLVIQHIVCHEAASVASCFNRVCLAAPDRPGLNLLFEFGNHICWINKRYG